MLSYVVSREELYGSVYKQVSETRGWAIEAMTTLKQKSGSGKGELLSSINSM